MRNVIASILFVAYILSNCSQGEEVDSSNEKQAQELKELSSKIDRDLKEAGIKEAKKDQELFNLVYYPYLEIISARESQDFDKLDKAQVKFDKAVEAHNKANTQFFGNVTPARMEQVLECGALARGDYKRLNFNCVYPKSYQRN